MSPETNSHLAYGALHQIEQSSPKQSSSASTQNQEVGELANEQRLAMKLLT